MEDNYEWLEVIESTQKHPSRVQEENAPISEGWKLVYTHEYVMSSGQTEYISYIFERKKK
jgi:hypothetical protein